MSESLGQGYCLVYDYILPNLRPLAEFYSFHFPGESSASEKAICQAV